MSSSNKPRAFDKKTLKVCPDITATTIEQELAAMEDMVGIDIESDTGISNSELDAALEAAIDSISLDGSTDDEDSRDCTIMHVPAQGDLVSLVKDLKAQLAAQQEQLAAARWYPTTEAELALAKGAAVTANRVPSHFSDEVRNGILPADKGQRDELLDRLASVRADLDVIALHSGRGGGVDGDKAVVV